MFTYAHDCLKALYSTYLIVISSSESNLAIKKEEMPRLFCWHHWQSSACFLVYLGSNSDSKCHCMWLKMIFSIRVDQLEIPQPITIILKPYK